MACGLYLPKFAPLKLYENIGPPGASGGHYLGTGCG